MVGKWKFAFALPAVPRGTSDLPSEGLRAVSAASPRLFEGGQLMLTIFGQGSRTCDGISRRSFLTIGALGAGAGALTLPRLFAAEASAGQTGSRHKSVIHIFLGGGPPHQDTR